MKKTLQAIQTYQKIAASIENQIKSGILKSGSKLPTVKEIAQNHGVSAPTALKAINLLKTDGIIKTVWGEGSYVCDKENKLSHTATIVISMSESYIRDHKLRTYWDQLYSHNLLGIQSETAHQGIDNSTIFLPETLLNTPEPLHKFLASHIGNPKGALCLWPNLNDRQAENLIGSLNCPIIFDNTFRQLNHRNAVMIDTYANACNIMNHLISCGYRNIACMRGLNTENIYFSDRLRAYYQCLNDHSITVDPHLVFPSDENTLSITETCGLLLDKLAGPDPLAVFCFNDYRAILLLQEAQKRGITIPTQLAIAGFDGTDTAIEKGITTIRLPYEYMGKQAVELLTALVTQQVDSPAEQRISSGVVIGRSTTANPPLTQPNLHGRL